VSVINYIIYVWKWYNIYFIWNLIIFNDSFLNKIVTLVLSYYFFTLFFPFSLIFQNLIEFLVPIQQSEQSCNLCVKDIDFTFSFDFISFFFRRGILGKDVLHCRGSLNNFSYSKNKIWVENSTNTINIFISYSWNKVLNYKHIHHIDVAIWF
jgi:hypothetical protein